MYHHDVIQLAPISLTLSLSLFIPPSHMSLPAGRPNYILNSHRAVVSSCWSTITGVSMRRGPQENITYEFVLATPTLSHKTCSSDLDGFRDDW